MIGILPAARPDELVYGVVANYARGMYGEKIAAPSHTGWLGLESATQYGLCDSPRIIGERYEHPEQVIDQLWKANSVLPYAIAAFPAGRRDIVKSVLLSGSCQRGEVLAEMCLIPIGARRTALGLRWCPECADADRRRFGSAYWHRTHQLPGTAICLKHSLWLRCTNGVVRQLLYTSPDEVSRSDVRPPNRRKIPEAVREIARLDADWLVAAATIDAVQLRYLLLYEFTRRSGRKAKPDYSDGWSALAAACPSAFQRQWLDAGTSSFWAMQPARLVRAAFALGKHDVIAAKILPLMAYLSLGVDDVAKGNWRAELDELLESRGVLARPSQAGDPDWLANEEATRRLRKKEYRRRWRQRNPEKLRAYAVSWRARQSPETLREWRRRWRERNRDKDAASSRKWRQCNPEKAAVAARARRQRNREKYRAYGRMWRQRRTARGLVCGNASRRRKPKS